MEALIAFIFLAGCLFIFIGSVNGFLATKNVTKANRRVTVALREIDLLKNKLEKLERTIDSASPVTKKSESIDAVSPIQESEVAVQPPEDTPVISKIIAPSSSLLEKTETILSAIPAQSKTDAEDSEIQEAPVPDVSRKVPPIQTKRSVRDPKPRPKWLEKFDGMNWETFVGTYLIRIIGVLLVTVAVFIGLAQVVQKSGPEFRVFLGYCVGLALLAGGRFTEKKQPAYARVVYAGGLAVAYFVTFATHYISMSRIFENPFPSLVGMAAIVGIWAAIAQKRKSPVVALLVTVLGHFTIALAIFTVPNPAGYSVFGVVILSCGSAFFLLRNKWYYIAAVGMIVSYANHFALMTQSTGTDTVSEFVLGISVLTAYLLIFALAELFSPESLRRDTIPSAFRSIFVALNTSCYFALGSLLVNSYTFTQDSHHIFRYALAVLMLGIAILYYLRRHGDPLYNTYATKSIALLTLGLAFQFSGNSLTTWLSIEMVILLLSSRRSGLVITRILAHSVAVIAFLHGIYAFLFVMRFMEYQNPLYGSTLIQTLISVIAFGLYALLYERTDWSSRMGLGLTIPDGLQTALWHLDLSPDPSPKLKEPAKILNGLLLPYTYAITAGLLFLGYSLRLIDMEDRFNLYGLIAAGLLVLGLFLNTRPYTLVSLLYVALATIMTFHEMFDTTFPVSYLFGVLALCLSAVATESRFVPDRDALVLHRKFISPYLLYGVALWSVALYLAHFFDDQHYMISLLVLSVACAGLTRVLHCPSLALGATVVLFMTHIIWHIDNVDLGEYFSGARDLQGMSTLIAGLIVSLSIAGDRATSKWEQSAYAAVLAFIAFTTSLHFIYNQASQPWFGAVSALMAFGFLAYGIAFRHKAIAVFTLLTVVLSSLAHTSWAYLSRDELSTVPTILGFIATISLWITFEHISKKSQSARFKKVRSMFITICISAVTMLSLFMLDRIPALADLYLTVSWALLGVLFFALALVLTQKRYRYAGLFILTLATIRVVLFDTSNLDAFNRVLAFGGLGVILLGLGFGYTKAFGEKGTE